jgi:hypothetical protein
MKAAPKNTLKTSAFATCAFDRESPEKINEYTKVHNIFITLEEAFKLREGIDEAIRHIFAYKQSTSVGMNKRLHVAIHRDIRRISVHQSPEVDRS